MKTEDFSQHIRMLRRPEVEDRTGMKRSTIYENMARGSFPKPTKLGSKIVAWPEHEIERWLNEQIKKNRGDK
jgi:prophage regulatory protein